MRDLSDSAKQSFRSVPEVLELCGAVLGRLRTRGVRFRGKPVSKEVLYNVLVLHVHGLADEERDRVLGDGMSRLEEILGRGVSGSAGGADCPAAAPAVVPERVFSADPPAASGRAGRKKRG